MIVIYLAFRYIFGIIIAEKKTRMYDIQCCVLIILENARIFSKMQVFAFIISFVIVFVIVAIIV